MPSDTGRTRIHSNYIETRIIDGTIVLGLGNFKDSITLLYGAISYIEEFQKCLNK